MLAKPFTSSFLRFLRMQADHLGPYRLDRVLGRGGMGKVYAAQHEESGERCAIKVLSPTFAEDVHFRERFAAEIDTLRTLRHENIVRLFGYGEQDGQLFYAMELVEGENLFSLMQEGRKFHWREVIHFSIQICSALKHAHDHGVIHRDLKPANLIDAGDGVIKLTDFGIAKLFGVGHLTSAGGVIGTADFMSPEQAEGLPITHHSDFYSLGGVMYALLTKRPPFVGKSIAEVLHSLKYDEPTPVRRIVPSVPVELEELVGELLRKSPEDRVATAVVLSNRLKAMEFGLAQRDGEPGESLEFDDRPPRNKPVQATDAETAIRPTIELDNRPPGTEATPSAGNESLGDETIITEGNAIEPDTDDTISPSAPRTHYVTVEESSGSTIRLPTEVAEQPRGNSLWTTIALASALVALLAALIYSTWPESADDLYSRIIIVAAASPTSELLNVRGDMEHFVERFPDDHRSQEIKLYLRDHDGYRLWRRLERESRKIGGVDFLPVVERGFVAAFRDLQQEPDVARYKFEKLLESHADTTLETEDAQRCLDSAAHWLNRIPAPPQPTGS